MGLVFTPKGEWKIILDGGRVKIHAYRARGQYRVHVDAPKDVKIDVQRDGGQDEPAEPKPESKV